MTHPVTFTVEIRLAWWVRHYVAAVCLFAWLHGAEPDADKLTKVIARGIRTRAA